MENLIHNYLNHIRCKKHLTTRTIDLYAQQLACLIDLCRQVSLDCLQIENHHIRTWIARAHAKGRSPQTISLQLASWRGFYKWLINCGHLSHNPCLNIKPFKKNQPLPKALSVDEVMALTQPSPVATKSQKNSTLKTLLIIELLYGCGLRVSELAGLDIVVGPDSTVKRRGWIDQTAKEVHIFGKGGKSRIVPLGQQAAVTLNYYLASRKINTQQNALLLNAKEDKRISRQEIWSLLKKHSLQMNLNIKVHPHMLRHSFASHILQSSGNLRAVQELLGHQSIASTQIYTRLNFQHLATTYDNNHPRAKLKNKQPV